MNNPYSLVVFDWEGTLADTLGQILEITAIEAKILGFGSFDIQQARHYVTLGLSGALKRLFPELAITQQIQLMQAVQHALLHRASSVSLLPGAKDFIERLHESKIDMAIATNKGHLALGRALHMSGLDAYFKVTRSADQVSAKPNPEMLQEIMDEFAVKPAATLMIGDSVNDMEMARSLQVPAIGIDFYHQQTTALKAAGALAVFDEYALLANHLHLPKKEP